MSLSLPIQSTPINTNVRVVDNFMPEDYCDYLIHEMTDISSYFPWHWGEVLPSHVKEIWSDITCPHNRNWQFSHVFWKYGTQNSEYCSLIQPLIDAINPDVLFRVKANIHPWEETQTVHGFHTDESAPGLTSIFYVNTNNGKTTFRMTNEEGEYEYTEVESKKGRLTTFDNRIMHSGSNHTDTQFRIVIAVNYFKHSLFFDN